MLEYRLSPEADSDLDDISDYTLENWGAAQTVKYLADMHRTFEKLADNPFIARDASRLVPDARIFTFEAHAIFYKILDTEIYIFRILGQKQDFERHL